MFEIRVICDPTETEHIVAALDSAFTAGTVTFYPSRDGKRNRLYVRADHRPAGQPWPDPETAYTLAPSILSEIGWTTHAAASAECFTELDRDYYLRKAAVLDRIALADEASGICGDTSETAEAAAVYLMDLDHAPVICGPRYYVRQQYAAWAKREQRPERPNA
ncbi:hypothetical protein U9R90_35615 [Streptomyces sp. E11-3]|uniref:hypothetical protein n=1 Tax=Streptomyces sp. E11-3 TaxID=3110112 RepID=UPI003980F749